jgi:hypothetical protein
MASVRCAVSSASAASGVVAPPELLLEPAELLLDAGQRLTAARGQDQDAQLLEEALDVGVPGAVRELCPLALGELGQRLRDVVAVRHLGAADEHADDRLAEGERVHKLSAQDVFRIVEAAATLVVDQPVPADGSQDDLGVADRVADDIRQRCPIGMSSTSWKTRSRPKRFPRLRASRSAHSRSARR